jgi:NADH pyrophosphatase NudC (nudix superfamily)
MAAFDSHRVRTGARDAALARRHKFCGACGGELGFVRAGWLGRCARCGSEHYPRTDQAIIAAVTDGNACCSVASATGRARRWSVIAGFVEPGESLEQTVAREVLEETGVRVRSCRYVASQPWPFPGSLMLGFLADGGPRRARGRRGTRGRALVRRRRRSGPAWRATGPSGRGRTKAASACPRPFPSHVG